MSAAAGGVRVEPLRSVDDLERFLGGSPERPVWIFKHSLTCSVSSVARREFEAFVGRSPDRQAGFGLIEIQTARPVSAAVARRSGVRHESPQAILFRAGEAVWHASHWAITAAALAEAQADPADGA